jgi:putative transposase
VTLRFDPRDMGEIRVFHHEGFLCRAVSADLAGETVPLREIIRARNRRRRELRTVLRDRQHAVDTLLEIKRGEATETEDAIAPSPTQHPAPALKRYRNE